MRYYTKIDYYLLIDEINNIIKKINNKLAKKN